MRSRTEMERISKIEFRAKDATLTMKREYGTTPNGNPMSGRWVVRNQAGEMVDFDQYANDLAERLHLKLY